MKWIRERVREGKVLAGTFVNLGSSVTAEIAGRAGFDWLLIDLEHGSGDRQELLLQLQAIEGTPAVPIVRVGWNDPVTIKRILDLGPSGIMIPCVNTAEEARRAVSSMRYPPKGNRGVARFNRACGFAQTFEEYFQQANEQLLTVVQIETGQAVRNAEEIAAVEGVDVLFIGPMDLSVSLGLAGQAKHPKLRDAMRQVAAACKAKAKVAGTLVANPDDLEQTIADGFTFVACGSDGSSVAAGLKNIVSRFEPFR